MGSAAASVPAHEVRLVPCAAVTPRMHRAAGARQWASERRSRGGGGPAQRRVARRILSRRCEMACFQRKALQLRRRARAAARPNWPAAHVRHRPGHGAERDASDAPASWRRARASRQDSIWDEVIKRTVGRPKIDTKRRLTCNNKPGPRLDKRRQTCARPRAARDAAVGEVQPRRAAHHTIVRACRRWPQAPPASVKSVVSPPSGAAAATARHTSAQTR